MSYRRKRRELASPEAASKWASAKLGAPRGSLLAIRSTNERDTDQRGFVRFWLRCNGVSGGIVKTLAVPVMLQAWNDVTDATLRRLQAQQADTSDTDTDDDNDGEQAEETTVQLNLIHKRDADEMQRAAPVAGDPAAMMMQAFQMMQQQHRAPMDEAAVRRIVLEAVADIREEAATRIIVQRVETSERKDMGRQHKAFPALLKACSARVNVWLRGPAGSGKTTAAHKAAEALGLAFYFSGAVDTEYKLLGFTNAQGVVVSRPFREAWTKGGVFLFDEIDASLPGALLALNAALANGICDFPDGAIPAHPDFVCIAAANTWGLGASAEYVGRMKQDAALLSRFPVMLDWPVDETLERAIAPHAAWTAHVQRIRAAVATAGIKVQICPRISLSGGKLIASGAMTWKETEEHCVRSRMTADQWAGLGISSMERAA